MMDEGGAVRVEGERLSVKEEGRRFRSGYGSGSMDLDLDLDPWIRIRQNDADPVDQDSDPWSRHDR